MDAVWRIIPSRFPPIQLFERVTEPQDLEAIFELDALLSNVPQERHLCYLWDGRQIVTVYEKRELESEEFS